MKYFLSYSSSSFSLKFIVFLISIYFPTLLFGSTNTLSNFRYVDPNGFFTIAPPADWKVQSYPDDQRGKVAFMSNIKHVELRVLVAPVDFSTIEELIDGAKEIEKRVGKDTNIEKTSFFGNPAIKRSFKINGIRQLVYDFLVGNIHHNLQFGAPISKYSEVYSLVKNSMETYEPLRPTLRSSGATSATLAGKSRIAELAIKLGNLELAEIYIEEGLEINPSDSKLKSLKLKLEKLKNK